MRKKTVQIFKFLVFIIILSGFTDTLLANDTARVIVPKIEWSGYGGKILVHREAMADIAEHPYMGTELRLGLQTTGNKYWHEVFNYPSYGIGIHSGFFINNVIGNPIAIFTYLDLPFLRKDKFYLSTTWGVGGVFNIDEYDEVSNPDNIAIGTDLNAYVNFSAGGRYKISEKWEIGTNIKFQHYSNGAIKKPNLGLNLLSGEVILAFYPGKTLEDVRKRVTPKPYKKYEFNFWMAGGVNINDDLDDPVQTNYTLSISASRRINYKRNVGIGFDVFYNEYFKYDIEIPEDEVTNSDLISYAAFLSTELIVGKFRLGVQLGTYMYTPYEYEIPVYERVALRYYFIPNLFGNISVKANGATAEYIEWGLGVAF